MLKPAKILGCIVLLLCVSFSAGGSHADENAKRHMQFGLYGFRDGHVTISVNSEPVFDETVANGLAFFFYDVPERATVHIVVDGREQSETFITDKGSLGFRITNGNPVKIELVDYGQGLD